MESSVTGHILKHSEIDLNLLMHVLRFVWIPSHNYVMFFCMDLFLSGPSELPRGLRRGTSVVCLLGLWARIPPGARVYVCCVCCLLSGRGLCIRLMNRLQESHRMWCVWVSSRSLDSEEALAHQGLSRHGGGAIFYSFLSTVQWMYLTVKVTECLS